MISRRRTVSGSLLMMALCCTVHEEGLGLEYVLRAAGCTDTSVR
jgi:hypothetical protein